MSAKKYKAAWTFTHALHSHLKLQILLSPAATGDQITMARPTDCGFSHHAINACFAETFISDESDADGRPRLTSDTMAMLRGLYQRLIDHGWKLYRIGFNNAAYDVMDERAITWPNLRAVDPLQVEAMLPAPYLAGQIPAFG